MACSGDDSGDSDTLTITSNYVKGHALGDTFRSLMDEFSKSSGVKVEVQDAINEDLAKAYEAARLAGDETDIVLTNYTQSTRPWVGQGQVVDVKPLITKWGLADRLKPGAAEEWTNDAGQTSAFPYTAFHWPIWYNTKILKDAQQHMTKEQTKQLYLKGGYCGPEALKGIEQLTKLRAAGVFPDNVEGYTADMMTTAYQNGQAAMMPAGSWGYQDVPKAIVEATVLGGFPTLGGTYSKPTAFNGNTSTGIWISPAGNKKLDLVEKFVKFMYEPSSVSRFVKEAGMVPATKDTLETPNKLLTQSLTLPDKVEFLVLPDAYIPVPVSNLLTPVTVTAYAPNAQPGKVCAAVEDLYKNNK